MTCVHPKSFVATKESGTAYFMVALAAATPGTDVLVALAPQELAEVVLRLVHERRPNGAHNLAA